MADRFRIPTVVANVLRSLLLKTDKEISLQMWVEYLRQ